MIRLPDNDWLVNLNASTHETATTGNITMDDDEIIGRGDEGFDDYIEQTTETGDVPLIVVVVFGIMTQFILLPILVMSRRRYLRKKRRAESDEQKQEEENLQEQDEQKQGEEKDDDDDDESSNSTRPIVVEDDLPTLFDADPTCHHRHPTKNRRTADGRKRRVAQGIEEEGRISMMQRQDNQEEDQQKQQEEEGGDDDIEDQMEGQVELTDTEQDKEMSKPNGVNKKDTSMNTSDRSSSLSCKNILAESRVLFRFDNEAKRILRLAIPFTLSELVDEVSEIVVLGIISLQLGTDALSAYAVFETLMEITTEFSGGVVDAMTTLASQAYGAGNNVLAGQYVQLCSVTYVLFQIPFILMWSFATFDIMIWMGFNEDVAQMSQTYARLAVWRDTVLGVSEVYSNLFEVVEKEFAVAVIGNAEALVELGAIAIALFLFDGDLVTVGVIGILNGLCFFLFTLAFTYWRGWLRPFASMFTSISFKNRVAVKQVIKTATPLAFGSVLIHGEWEVLTVFAAYLGAAEVTAWAVLGNLWDIFESSNEGIADAGEVRVAYHWGKGRPEQARISANKSVVIGLVFSIVLSCIFLGLGDKIPMWLTSDLTLQNMIEENIPLIAIGNIIMTGGNICWAILGAQGRYRLATFIFFLSSWAVTIPLAAISVYALFLDLKGLTTTVIIGFLCACTVLGYYLLLSDWSSLSQKVREINLETGEIDSSDDECSSVSSASSSSSSSSSASSSSDSSSSSSRSSCSSSSKESASDQLYTADSNTRESVSSCLSSNSICAGDFRNPAD